MTSSPRKAPVNPDELGVWAHAVVSYIKCKSVYIEWEFRFETCIRKRMYGEAVELLTSIPPWKNVDVFRDSVARDWAAWIESRILAFEFVYARRLFSPMIVIEASMLTELKVLWISRVRATRVLKQLLTHRKRQAPKRTPEPVHTTAPEQRAPVPSRQITEFFDRPMTCARAPARVETIAPEKRHPISSRSTTDFFRSPKRFKIQC